MVGLAEAFAIVQGAVKFGYELYKMYKSTDTTLEDDISQLNVGVSQTKEDVEKLCQTKKETQGMLQEVLDNQASLAALLAQGTDDICTRLDSLQSQLSQGFDAVMQTIKDEAARRDARKFKTNLDALTLAYEHIMDDMLSAAKRENNTLPVCINNDVKKAEESANDLYLYAKNSMPKNAENTQGATQRKKLQTMPYIVAMAYAAWVKVATYFLERDMAEEEEDKDLFLNRARTTVKDFIDVLSVALDRLMADTSLLDIALIYQLPLATYITLMTNFRSLVDDLLEPSTEAENVAVWDDGLSPIRAALQCKDGDDPQDQKIEFNNIKESLWWFTFIDIDYESMHWSTIRRSIDIRELCHVLGAANDEQSAHIELKPGQKSALLQLQSASALRAALCDKIAQARQAEPPQDFARINGPLPLGQIVHGAAATEPRILAGYRTLGTYTESVLCVAVWPDGKRVVSGSSDGECVVSGSSDRESVVFGSSDRIVKVWSLSSGRHLHTFSGHSNKVEGVAVSPDGTWAVSGSRDKSARVWSVDDNSAEPTVLGYGYWVRAVAVSPDGHSIASGSDDGTVSLWNKDGGKPQAMPSKHFRYVYCVAFSPDGTTLVSGSADNLIQLWNVRTGAYKCAYNGHTGHVRGVAVTPDGKWLVSGSEDETVKVWNLKNGAEEMMFKDHEKGVSCVAVFPDGERIVSGSEDNTVRVWNLRSKALELTLEGHSDTVLSVAVSSDGRSVVSGSKDKRIIVWTLGEGGAQEAEREG